MPLTPAYTWSETETSIRIEINNVSIKDQGQIFCSDRVIKLNAAPHLLVLDLNRAVDDDKSLATVLHGRKLVLQLVKAEPGMWGSLTAQGDKCEIQHQREESVKRAHAKQAATQQQRLARRQHQERAAIDLQIAQEKAQRDRIDTLKKQELQQERQQLRQWQGQLLQEQANATLQLQQQQRSVSAGIDSDDDDANVDGQAKVVDGQAKVVDGQAKVVDASSYGTDRKLVADHPDYYGRGWRPSRSDSPHPADSSTSQCQIEDADCSSEIKAATSNTEGSSRVARQRLPADSTAASPAAAAAAGAASVACKAISLSNCDSSNKTTIIQDNECDMQVNCFTSLADASMGAMSAAAATSGVHCLALDGTNLGQEVSNCVTEKLIGHVAPVRSRAAPVAVSFTSLETSHLPAREQREVEIKQIKRRNKGDSVDVADRQPAFLKDKGDALAAQGNYRGAINAYTAALDLDPTQIALYSNRSACYMALKQLQECEQDCSVGIDLLQKLQERLQDASDNSILQEVTACLLPAASAAGTNHDHAAAAAAVTAAAGTAAAAAAASSDTAAAVSPTGDKDTTELSTATASSFNDLLGVCKHAADAGSGTSVICPAATCKLAATGAASETAEKMRQQLVKLLARRAAAWVMLQQLSNAEQDLQLAIRLDPNNAQLQADALEIAASMEPSSLSDPCSMKQRGDARFKAGDWQGARQAYSMVIDLWQQQQQQQQHPAGNCRQQLDGQQHQQQLHGEDLLGQQPRHALLLSALSNRAACWLALEDYQQCAMDCTQGLLVALRQLSQRAELQLQQSALPGTATHDTSSAVLQLLAAHPATSMLQAAGPLLVRSMARLISRLAIAQGCLKQMQAAQQLYGLAQQYWAVLGEGQRAAELVADQNSLLSAEQQN